MKRLVPLVLLMLLGFVASCPSGDSRAARAAAEGRVKEADGVSRTEAAKEDTDVALTPSTIRQRGNHLVAEQSLYLQQHAYNPIDWYPWGEEALERARREDKPVFLSVGYSSCHWCHVMEHEVFEDDDVASYMNEHFVCIKVDREERPDLDAVYMQALQLMTGSGGWPMSLFLTSELKPFWGATYLPRDQFLAVARQLHDVYTTDRVSVGQVGGELHELVSRAMIPASGNAFGTTELEAVISGADYSFDETWGGFGSGPKFPTPPRWRFLLHYYRFSGDDHVGEMIKLTLDRMGDGGIHDHVGGGFHRYAVEPTWLIPHFEKMLYDNAQLASLYTEASVVFSEPRYGEVARDTLEFMLSEMADADGGFYASFDADSGGEEGSYYSWTPEELAGVVGGDGRALALLLGVSEDGNFEGANVLSRRVTLEDVADETGMEQSAAAGLFAKHRFVLQAHRSLRVAPALDKKIVTAWNGLAISAMAQAYSVFGDEKYRVAAEKAAQYLWQVHRRADGSLARSSTNGAISGDGILDDYAMLSGGLLDLYNATGEVQQLERALELIDYALERFVHPEAGFYLTPDDVEVPMGRQLVVHDSVEPSGNAAMLLAIQRAAAITGKAGYYDAVELALARYSGQLTQAGLEMAAWQDLALLQLAPYYTVVVAGDASAAQDDLLAAARRGAYPHVAVVQVPAAGAGGELARIAPAVAEKPVGSSGALAYVCEFGACQAPTDDPAELLRQIQAGWKE
jgi:uncharacterized protein YyaL (SSP411 family)